MINGINSYLKYNYMNTLSTKSSYNYDKLQATSKVLGYEIDNEGYSTSEFNKAAEIPEDIKIHSSTMESLVKISTNEKNPLRAFESIDIAKTVGNAYKILSQVVGEDVLNSKDNFNLEEIANFPQGYEFNRQTMQVTKFIILPQIFLIIIMAVKKILIQAYFLIRHQANTLTKMALLLKVGF